MSHASVPSPVYLDLARLLLRDVVVLIVPCLCNDPSLVSSQADFVRYIHTTRLHDSLLPPQVYNNAHRSRFGLILMRPSATFF